MMYADFSYYRDQYLGAVITDEAEYGRFAKRATEEINLHTFGRAAYRADSAAVKNAVCAVAEVLKRMEECDPTRSDRIQAEKVDDYSVTHVTPFNTAQGWEASRRRQITNALRTHLFNTGLMYAGASFV
jgi:hypothetical protein